MDSTDQHDWEATKEYSEKAGRVAADLRKYSMVRYAALAVLVVTLPTAVILVQRQTGQTRTLAAPSEARAYFVPNYAEIPPGRQIKLVLDTDMRQLSRVRVGIKFDSRVMNLTGEVITTAKLKTVREKTGIETANVTGKMRLDLGLADIDRQNPPEGVVELASLFFVPVNGEPGMETKVEIDPADVEVIDNSGNKLVVTAMPADVVLNLSTDEQTVLGANIEPEIVSGYESVRMEADMDGDGCVGFTDLRTLGVLLGKKVVPGTLGDANGDGNVNLADLGTWIGNYGYGCR